MIHEKNDFSTRHPALLRDDASLILVISVQYLRYIPPVDLGSSKVPIDGNPSAILGACIV